MKKDEQSIILININKNKNKKTYKRKKVNIILKRNIFIISKLLLICLLCLALIIINTNLKLINMYIVTHKDFANDVIVNPLYKILCDDKSQLQKNYKLEIIETNKNNLLYPKRRGYSEGSKIYPIWKLYKEGKLASKYVGLFHYRRIFPFKNDLIDLDNIFDNYDVIVSTRNTQEITIREQFNKYHILHFLDESVDIIQELFPKYYPYAKIFLEKKWANYCNIFIMKQNDFIKWGEFTFGVLLELDKRYNLTSDEDIEKLIKNERRKIFKYINIPYQSRLESFLMERIGNIFYEKHFHKRYEITTVDI